MTASLQNMFVVALSSRALFDLEEENRIFESETDASYMELQLSRLEKIAAPGCAFPLAKKLLALNSAETQRVEVVLLSRNDPVSGLRAFRSAELHGLQLTRGVFTRGSPAYRYLAPLGAKLFLSAHEDDVRGALEAGFPAARVYATSSIEADRHPNEIRIAFDGDSVLFSDEAERVFKKEGLSAFTNHEQSKILTPLPPGPFKPLLDVLHKIQQETGMTSPIKVRTALVTAMRISRHREQHFTKA